MKRSDLTIGDKVFVIPNNPVSGRQSPQKIMYVRELHNKTTAGLSHTPKGKGIYGILYAVIHPIHLSKKFLDGVGVYPALHIRTLVRQVRLLQEQHPQKLKK